MAECGSGSVGTCLNPLFIMKHNGLENLSHSVYSNSSSDLSNSKCLAIDEKAYFSSSPKIDAIENGVLNACKCKDLHDDSSDVICSPTSPLEDSDNFKKKRCMDRYDSSESSDSGVLTGSTCSESSSNSGNSDIIDPCSPCSVTSFHLGDDSGCPLALASKSSTFPTDDDLLASSKMLPENLNREEENEVSCWAWNKTIDWNERYELTSDDIDVAVKNSDYFNGITDKQNENDVENNVKIRPNYYPNQDGKSALKSKLSFSVPLLERKNLTANSVSSFHAKESSRPLSNKTGLKSVDKDAANNRKVLRDTDKKKKKNSVALPNTLDITEDTTSQPYFYEEVFQQKRIDDSAHLSTVYDKSNALTELDTSREQVDAPSDVITASKEDDNQATNDTCFVNNSSYPLDFFNILPSVFKGPILYSANDMEEDYISDEAEAVKLSNLVETDRRDHHDHFNSKILRTEPHHTSSNNLFCRKELKNNMTDIATDISSRIHNNNNDEDDLMLSSKNKNDSFEMDLNDTTSKLPCRAQTRFPSDRKSSLSDRMCRWSDCVDHVSSSTKLIEHLQTKHVYPQTFNGTFICLWKGCKVFGRPSCSRTFLERHVLSHGGNKPYRCIVDNCGQRFSSQLMLERHVNQHFKTPKEVNDGPCDTTPKLIRRNGQKLRYRRQPYSVRNRADAFDAGVMAQLQYSLVQMTQRSSAVNLSLIDSKQFLNITFQPKVIGNRQEKDGKTKYLIRWYPYNSLEDEWLSKSEIENTRTISIWELPASVQQMFWNSVFPKQSPSVRQPRKYKPESSNT